ncbi:MAG: Hpt domain-containing protein [Methylacidiphilales bacterium]|nr:Hpt domain-containing protein [Candidatus Methylacidiphilales bacterium]
MNPYGVTLDKIIPLSLDRLEAGASTLDEIDKELFPFFEEEAKTELKSIETLLHGWDKPPPPINDLVRQFHTLKGAANSIGHVRIGALAGGIKDLLEQMPPDHATALQPQIIKTNIQVIGAIQALLQEARDPEHNAVKKEQIVLAIQAILRLQEMEISLRDEQT